jgi:hypothetical protein
LKYGAIEDSGEYWQKIAGVAEIVVPIDQTRFVTDQTQIAAISAESAAAFERADKVITTTWGETARAAYDTKWGIITYVE